MERPYRATTSIRHCKKSEPTFHCRGAAPAAPVVGTGILFLLMRSLFFKCFGLKNIERCTFAPAVWTTVRLQRKLSQRLRQIPTEFGRNDRQKYSLLTVLVHHNTVDTQSMSFQDAI